MSFTTLAHKGVGPHFPGFGFSRGTTLMGRLSKYSDAVPGLVSYSLAPPAHIPDKQTLFLAAQAPRLGGNTCRHLREQGPWFKEQQKHRVNAGIHGGWQQGGRILYEKNGGGPCA
jgi:hypothetical protein